MKLLGFLLLLLFVASPAFSQNTKGDQPVKNQRQVRETKGKSYKRKERGNTRDIAGRRLRTKGQSSANRANASYRQSSPYYNRSTKQPDRAAPVRGKVFSKSPRESKVRAWRGDVSGYRVRRIKPTGADAARNNVYPQKGPYVRYARKRPKEKPPVYSRTIKGTRFVEHRPRAEERAWKGGLDKGPIKNQSATGSTRNTYSQRGPYVSYYKKHSARKEKSYSNRTELSQVKRFSRPPKSGGSQARLYPSSGSRPYVQRGRKNVYWGKFQKKEQGISTDITGGPLRTRNYKSPTAGLVGRDSLKFFGRKPGGDRSTRLPGGGYATATQRARSWKGDVAGWPVRNPRAQQARSREPLKPTPPGMGAIWLSRIFNKNFRGVKPKDLVPDTRSTRYQGNIPSFGSSKTFGDQGTGYPGNIKRGSAAGFSSGGVGYSGTIRRGGPGFVKSRARYSGNIRRGTSAGFSRAGTGYSGNLKRSEMGGFGRQGEGYSGNVRRGSLSAFSKSGFGYSGFLKRSQVGGFSQEGMNYSGKLKRGQGLGGDYIGYSGTLRRDRAAGFSRAGVNYAGNLKERRGFSGDYIGYSGNIERVGAVKQFEENGVEYSGFMKREGRGFSGEGINYSGNIKRSSQAGFSNDGAGFSGRNKSKKIGKGGGSVSGILWNNQESPLSQNPPLFTGDINYAGRTKAKRQAKGGGSISGLLWNNQEAPLSQNPPMNTGDLNYAGRSKAKRPAKGGGTVSGILWNNQESSLAKNPPMNTGDLNYAGRSKAKRPTKGGGSVSGIMWNNQGSALAKSPPPGAGAPGGLQVKVIEGDYSRKPKASKYALPGIAPTRASVKANEYSRNMKQYWDYKHNPNSSRYALKGIGPGKAKGRIGDFQGNAKMHKYGGSGMHPDAKFAHSEEDNVKEERSFFTNVKVFWSKMFHKNEGQPSSVKDKGKKLQYDKREKGLWAY